MKKILITFVTIFLLTASLAGCGNDQYSIERQYWKIKQEAGKIFQNPEVSPPQEVKRVTGILDNFAKKYPKNSLSLEAQFNVARLYMTKKEYEKARAYLKTMLTSYREFPGVLAETLFLIGNSYEIQDNWQAALEQYQKIEQEYPLTLRGMDIPIYIAIHYKVKYDPEKMLEAFRQAVSHYKQLASQHPNTPLALNAEGLAAHCYVAMKEWQNAILAFNEIIEKYKDKVNTDRIMFGIAMIYDQQIKNRAKAIEALQRLIREYPKSTLLKPATEQLKKWEKDAGSQGNKPPQQ